jgi:excinuclease ABC subunit C
MSPDPPVREEGDGAPQPPDPAIALGERIARFPTTPGVYVMRDAQSRVLYVGKAVNLRSRVRSYFGKSSDSRVFHEFLVRRVAEVDCIVTGSEAEALILENNLIKKHRPVYNIRLKDDKTYVSVKVSLEEDWPRVLITRRYHRDGNLYFGPYGSTGSVREMLRVIKAVFALRTCSSAFFKGRTRPCMEHEIGRCTAPCVGLVDRAAYRAQVDEAVLFLKGRTRELLGRLEEGMREAAEARHYELAARYRDQIRAVEKAFESQAAQEWGLGDLDVFATAREGDHAHVEELLVRGGKVTASRCHTFRTALGTAEVLASFLAQYYLVERYVPQEILCDADFPDRPLIEEWLREKRGLRVTIAVPERGDKAKLVEMARRNALNSFAVSRGAEEQFERILGSLQSALGARRPPRKIECVDISTFQGDQAVGALVRFEDGLPAKDGYRRYRIQTVVGADDFRCIAEVTRRRLKKGLEAGDLPDLLLIDGGKGQLAAAAAVARELGAAGLLDLASLAKERRHKGTAERIFLPTSPEPIPLAQDTPESLYLQRVRDEAHRFAVRYHRELREKTSLRSGLEQIPGLGPKRRAALLDRFSDVRGVRAATEAELAEVVGPVLARKIKEAPTLRGRPSPEPPKPGGAP